MKVKDIQIDGQMYTSVISIVIPTLEEIGLQMSEHKPT